MGRRAGAAAPSTVERIVMTTRAAIAPAKTCGGSRGMGNGRERRRGVNYTCSWAARQWKDFVEDAGKESRNSMILYWGLGLQHW